MRTNTDDGTIPNKYQPNGRTNSAETNQNKYFCTQEFTIDFSLSLVFFFFLFFVSSFVILFVARFAFHTATDVMIPNIQYRSFVWFFILQWHRLWMAKRYEIISELLHHRNMTLAINISESCGRADEFEDVSMFYKVIVFNYVQELPTTDKNQ